MQFGQEGIEPSIRGNRLTYVRQTGILGIWKRELHSQVSAGPPTKFISSSRMDSGPQFSPDGRRIVFESTRSGPYEIWMSRSDGTGLRSSLTTTHSVERRVNHQMGDRSPSILVLRETETFTSWMLRVVRGAV
jgi:WD40-like Beta Propeller Repeat